MTEAQHLSRTMQLLKLMGSNVITRELVDRIFADLWRSAPEVSEEDRKKLQDKYGEDVLFNRLVVLAANHLSETDIDTAVEFFSSPVGKNITDNDYRDRATELVQQWGEELKTEAMYVVEASTPVQKARNRVDEYLAEKGSKK
tara:strand:- start:565 stop:993 length:429 start_codon:yes stop_codon:yes gene_type:complete